MHSAFATRKLQIHMSDLHRLGVQTEILDLLDRLVDGGIPHNIVVVAWLDNFIAKHGNHLSRHVPRLVREERERLGIGRDLMVRIERMMDVPTVIE